LPPAGPPPTLRMSRLSAAFKVTGRAAGPDPGHASIGSQARDDRPCGLPGRQSAASHQEKMPRVSGEPAMGKRAIVLTSVITAVTALAAGAYLWVQATYALPAASCGLWAMPGQLPGTPGAAQCFAAAARTCAAAGVRVHWRGWTAQPTTSTSSMRAGRRAGARSPTTSR
jgi:hypothetical protein